MCGVYSIIARGKSGLSHDDSEVLKQMMLDTVQRGDNSSGLFMTEYQHPEASPTGVKVLGGPHNIIYNDKLWKDICRNIQVKAGAVVGHGRYATKGKVTAQNAHPFQHEHITLVHNGTIHRGVSYQKKGDVDIDVDSHALAVAMAEKGVAQALAEIHGAYAVIVHDAKEQCIYVARNNERPLHIYSNHYRHYIMSEGPFLDVILERYNKKIKDSHIMYFTPEKLIKFDLKDPGGYTTVADIGKMRSDIFEAERKKLEEEAAERRKKFGNGVGHGWNNVRPANSVDKNEGSRLEREIKPVLFCVKSYAAYGPNFRYSCLTPDGRPLCFISDQIHPEYLDKIGRAKIHSYVKKNSADEVIFVKHRDITWLLEHERTGIIIPGEIQTVKEEDTGYQAGSFRTFNNKRISTTEWTKRYINEGCNTCDKKFSYLDYRNVILTDDNMLLCQECAAEFHVGTNNRMH